MVRKRSVGRSTAAIVAVGINPPSLAGGSASFASFNSARVAAAALAPSPAIVSRKNHIPGRRSNITKSRSRACQANGTGAAEERPMQEEKLPLSVSTPAEIAQLTGVSPVRLICSRTDDTLAAALWRFPRSSRPLVIEDVPQNILACQWAGSPVKTKVSHGLRVRKQVKVGAVTFVPGDDRSEWSWDGPSEMFAVYFGAQTIRSFAEEHFDAQPVPRIADFFAIEDPWLLGYFHMLVSEYELLFAGDSETDSLLLDHTRHLLVRHLVRWHSDAKGKRLAALDGQTRVSPLPSAVVRRILDFVDANLTGEISLRTLADLAAMSVEHFLRSFKAATGQTPHRYVVEQRLHKAAAMLSSGRWPISAVCAACGFKSPKHFSQKFRSTFGIPPSIYRKQHCNAVPAFDPVDERPHREIGSA